MPFLFGYGMFMPDLICFYTLQTKKPPLKTQTGGGEAAEKNL